jgi:hypothetical protein
LAAQPSPSRESARRRKHPAAAVMAEVYIQRRHMPFLFFL